MVHAMTVGASSSEEASEGNQERYDSGTEESSTDDSEVDAGQLAGLAASMWGALQKQRRGLLSTSIQHCKVIKPDE